MCLFKKKKSQENMNLNVNVPFVTSVILKIIKLSIVKKYKIININKANRKLILINQLRNLDPIKQNLYPVIEF